MAKRFLESQGVKRGAGDAIDELAERIVRYLDDGQLTREAVLQMHRELLESGDKRVYAMRTDPAKLRRVRASEFGGLAISSLDGAQVRRTPTRPHLNYALVSDGRLRFSFSETHTHWRPVAEPRGWSQRVETNVIVIDADTSTGFVTVAFDAPGDEHPHGSSDGVYYDHYISVEAPALLGAELEPLEWGEKLRAIEHDRYRGIVRYAGTGGVGACGTTMRYVPSGAADLRDSAAYQHARADIAVRKSARLIWSATTPRPDDLGEVRAGNALLRDVKTELFASPAVIRFSKHTLSHEMAYVLQTTQSIA